MTGINHFQTYSQRENHLTNNTLLMLRHVYRSSPLKLEHVLRSVVGDENLEVGPRFTQQRRAARSIPDSVIEQAAFHLYVEAKHAGKLAKQQLNAHLESIRENRHASGSAFLVGLARHMLPETEFAVVEAQASALGIHFGVCSYEDLLQNLKEACAGDAELEEILDDYRTFIAGEGLLPDQYRKIVAFLCGTSWLENVRHGVYYEPARRNPKWAQAHLIGTYKNKRLTHVGRLKAAAICKRTDGVLQIVREEYGQVHETDKTRIQQSIEGGTPYYPNLADEPHRFYVVEDFIETDVRKASVGSMRGHRYFDLVDDFEIDPKTLTMEQIAERLRGKTYS